MALTLFFCIGDIDAALHTKTHFPTIEIFYQGVQDITGAALMTSMVTTLSLSLCAAVSTTVSTSRQSWAFSRDRAVPGWERIQRVNSKSAIPMHIAFLTVSLACVPRLHRARHPPRLSTTSSRSSSSTFSAIYFLLAVLLLWRYLRDDVKLYPSSADLLINVPDKELAWDP